MARFNLNNLSTIKTLVANNVLMGFKALGWSHNNERMLRAHGVVI